LVTLLTLCGHVVFDVVFGWTLLSFHQYQRSWTETLFLSVLFGMYVETLSIATLMFLGVSLMAAGLWTAVGMGALTVSAVCWGRLHYSRISVQQPKWYEWALMASVGEKMVFAVWQLTRTPTYFDDALAHWSGRARSLFGEVNWSFDPASSLFLGGNIGNRNYPLQTVIWRAISAKLNGEWNEIISRADGLIFFIVIVATIWLAVWRFSNLRWVAAAAAFVVSAVPLHAWHAAAGYSDIAVEAFVVAALAALLRAEWFVGGVMAAGAIWSKNDALVLYFPSLLIAAGLLQMSHKTFQLRWRNVRRFLSGFATIGPWLMFNYIHGLGITPGQSEVAWHPDAPGLLWAALMKSPTSSTLWISILACLIFSCVAMFNDTIGRALILAFLISLCGIVLTFSSTSAYQFLADETTIHRVMMQFSGMAILVATFGLWLKTPSAAPFKGSRRRDVNVLTRSSRSIP